MDELKDKFDQLIESASQMTVSEYYGFLMYIVNKTRLCLIQVTESLLINHYGYTRH